MATESENESRYTESHGASYIPRRGNPNRMALTVMYTLCHDIRRFLPDSSSRRILNVVVEIKCGRDSVADVDWYELDVPFELDGIVYTWEKKGFCLKQEDRLEEKRKSTRAYYNEHRSRRRRMVDAGLTEETGPASADHVQASLSVDMAVEQQPRIEPPLPMSAETQAMMEHFEVLQAAHILESMRATGSNDGGGQYPRLDPGTDLNSLPP